MLVLVCLHSCKLLYDDICVEYIEIYEYGYNYDESNDAYAFKMNETDK